MGDGAFVRFAVVKRIKADRTADEAFIRMFKDEARITSELHHNNIGQVYDFGRHEDEYFLALEYVPGIDVRHLINTLRDRGQRVPIRVALRVLYDVLEALDYAHRKRDSLGRPMDIVHRDVNPRNIMVSIHGETKLIDFGVAKATNRLERTKTDHVKGKFSYMAPEQVSETEIDHRADLFAVGLTLHELLAGYSPFYGLNQVQIVHKLLNGPAPKMPDVRDVPDEDALRALHDKAVAYDPDERYPSAKAMQEDLLAIAQSVGGLPSSERMARFLDKIEPDLSASIRKKIKRYTAEAEGGDPVDTTTPAMVKRREDDTVESAVTAAAPPVHAEHSEDTSLAQTVVGGLIGMSLVGGLTLVGVVLVFVVGVSLWRPWDTPPPGPVPAATPLPASDPEPSPHPDPDSEDDPEPAPRPDPVEPAPRPRPTPRPDVRPRFPAPVADPEPEPNPEPVAAVDPSPAPDPEPEPEVDRGDFGKLRVVSRPAGRTVIVDGVEKGETPIELPVPPGSYVVQVEGFEPRTVRVLSKQVEPVLFK